MDRRKECLVSAFCAFAKFSQKSGNCYFVFFSVWNTHNCVILVFSCIMATCSDRDDEFSSALVLCIIYTDRGYMQCLEAMNKWSCGDCYAFYSVMLHDDVLIENNKYGWVIICHYGYINMQNNGALKMVNFTHEQTAETRHSSPVNEASLLVTVRSWDRSYTYMYCLLVCEAFVSICWHALHCIAFFHDISSEH